MHKITGYIVPPCLTLLLSLTESWIRGKFRFIKNETDIHSNNNICMPSSLPLTRQRGILNLYYREYVFMRNFVFSAKMKFLPSGCVCEYATQLPANNSIDVVLGLSPSPCGHGWHHCHSWLRNFNGAKQNNLRITFVSAPTLSSTSHNFKNCA